MRSLIPPSRKIGHTDVQQKHIEELQKWWSCDAHSKGSQSHSYCYSPPGSTICQALTQSLTPTPIFDGFCVPSASPFTPSVTLMPTNSGTEIPEIILWFNSLEQHVKKTPCGVKLGDFGPELDTRGFIHISQLLHDYMSTQALQRHVED
ncbi:hypothetical protein PAXRUDRAFT_797451 [Paxillus rubicundulus Ve08.2h10]|uniref:Uncharacterized protein n=1 Tax=Paxillus rubicundulus Ve08.2h10 TaxID=930991 RepID=A0A0D0DSY6_9AGAM|nr:hypothetical protein PAXRUDRAFT_797451 [Paxillus rubicundulus Ve08.2h10]